MDLLLSAFPPELGEFLEAPPPGWKAACVGIGPLAAALETSRLLALHQPGRVLFLGTCGAYDERLGLGDLLAVSEVLDRTLSEARGEAFRPTPQESHWRADFLPPLEAHVVVAPPAITASLEGARLLATTGAAENLELGGVFAACKARGVPVGAALAVANRVGPEAHAEWAAHHAGASAQLREALLHCGFLGHPSQAQGGDV
jgi:nucleoside phosphorylase